MKIYIKYINNKSLINTNNYQSINSIINEYLNNNSINENEIDSYFLDYNGIILNKDNCLEKYEIIENSLLNLNRKIKGGNSNKNKFIIIGVALLFSLFPIFLLPLGFFPSLASLIKIIINKGLESLGRFLACDLGKITMLKRMRTLIFIIKYIIFILLIFVVITFPLILLCISLKGHSILDDPKSMCKPISMGNLAGLILTSVYMLYYVGFRCGKMVLNPIINFCKQYYILNTLINPILNAILNIYNKFKYIPITFIPFIGVAIVNYGKLFDLGLPLFQKMLMTISDLGCKGKFDISKLKNSINKDINKTVNEAENKNKNNENNENNEINENINESLLVFAKDPYLGNICEKSKSECCSPELFIQIGDILSEIASNGASAMPLKSSNLYTLFILLIQALYEHVLSDLDELENMWKSNYETKKIYLQKLLFNKTNTLTNSTKDLIKDYINNEDEKKIEEIKNALKINIPNMKKSNNNLDLISSVNAKLKYVEDLMIEYSKEKGTKYVPGKSLFKTIFKMIMLNSFCNVLTTTNSSLDVIREMGDVKEFADMIKAGSASGTFTSILYFITVIILIVCSIFKVF